MKTKLLLFAFFCSLQFINAQIVNIPDPEFKQALLNYSPNIDTNNDNQIQVTEAEAVISLTITGHQYFMDPGFPCDLIVDPGCVEMPPMETFGISDFTGINAFVNLTYLDCNSNDLSSLDVSALTQLTYLDFSSNINFSGAPYNTGISTLLLPATTTLTTLKGSVNNLSGTVDLTVQTNLESIDLYYNQITALLLPNTNTLQDINVRKNQITSLNLTANTGLVTLNCRDNQITALDLTTNTALTSLVCRDNQIATLNLTPNVLLETLDCKQNVLTVLNISQSTALTSLDCSINQLTSLDVLNNTLLTSVNCRNNLITSLDVTQQNSLAGLWCDNNDLSSLNMKNGNNAAITSGYFDARNNANLTLICVDDLTYASTTFNNINSQMFFADNCSFIPSGTNTITGTMAYDFDVNGCDPADVKSRNTKIATVSNNVSSLTFTNNNGEYTLYTPDASSTTSITPNFPSFFSVSPTSQVSNFTGTGNTDIVDYCITANSLVEDVSINVLPTFEARPGFQTSVRIFYKNNGSAIVSGSFNFTFEDNKQTLDSTTEAPSAQVGNQLTWNYTNLLPFESRFVDVLLTTNTPVDPVNPVNNGDTLNYTASITTTTGDSDTSNNTSFVDDITIGSYDPNDSIFLEGELITAQEATEFLHVRIRFQNTGTASAINIRVETLLDADLDWDTFEPITASHNFTTTLSSNNKAEFFFENIYLQDSTTDEPGSHGWVYFKIKAKPGFAVGDVADNTASIFFDYNAPIVTNNATTQIDSTLSIDQVFNNDGLFLAYPNPTKSNLNISIQAEATYRLVTINGQVIKHGQLQKGKNILNTSNLSNGLYFVQVETAKGISTKKIIKE